MNKKRSQSLGGHWPDEKNQTYHEPFLGRSIRTVMQKSYIRILKSLHNMYMCIYISI